MKRNVQREAAQATTAAIKELILARALHPGDAMPTENELVETLGVSRSSVREAVRTLVALDILEVRHGTGTFVGQLSLRPLVEGMVFRGVLTPGPDYAALRDVVEVRTGLDLSLAPRIVERLAGQDATDLRRCVDEITARADRGESFADSDRAFHLMLAERLGNVLYGQLVAAFWDIHRTVAPSLGVATRTDLNETAAAHARMLSTAVNGDLEGYRDAVLAHYEPLMRVLESSQPAPKGEVPVS